MKIKIKKQNGKQTAAEHASGKYPWDKGTKERGNAGSYRRPQDAPEHINPRTWKPIPGKKPTAYDMAKLKTDAVWVQAEIIRFFKDGHLNTGDFARWVRATKGNTMAFYSWVVRDLMPKSVQLSVIGGDGATPDELPLVVRIESRKDAGPKKK